MKELGIGVMGCANIAKKAMVPAMHKAAGVRLVGLASRSEEKAKEFSQALGGEAIAGYEKLLGREDIDAIYMPLPTGLHEEWIERCLKAGKHLLVEKSFAENSGSARKLLQLARKHKRCVIENYLFIHHSQTETIKQIVESGEIGQVRLLRTTFSFPPLARDNFRYDASLGGGALLDAGGYVLQAALFFLQGPLTVAGARLEIDRQLGVDVAGAAMLVNPEGIAGQCYFGFNSYYQCLLELLGTKGKLSTGRVFTAPPGLTPVVKLEWQGESEERNLPEDDHCKNMWEHFARLVAGGNYEDSYRAIEEQAVLQEQVRKAADG